MKNLLGFLLIINSILLLNSTIFSQSCKENFADESEHAVCAMETVTFRKVTTSQITGIVVFDGKPFENSIVELYKLFETEAKLIKKFKTQNDGRFCFNNLPKGKYRLKTATGKFEFRCTQIDVEIKGKTKRLITLPLEVGN